MQYKGGFVDGLEDGQGVQIDKDGNRFEGFFKQGKKDGDVYKRQEVFSEDGKVLGTFSMEKNNRVYSSYADLSPNIIDVYKRQGSGIPLKVGCLLRSQPNTSPAIKAPPLVDRLIGIPPR